MDLKDRLSKFYQRNKIQVRTLFYTTLLFAAAMKVGDIGFTALDNYMNSERNIDRNPWKKH